MITARLWIELIVIPIWYIINIEIANLIYIMYLQIEISGLLFTQGKYHKPTQEKTRKKLFNYKVIIHYIDNYIEK